MVRSGGVGEGFHANRVFVKHLPISSLDAEHHGAVWLRAGGFALGQWANVFDLPLSLRQIDRRNHADEGAFSCRLFPRDPLGKALIRPARAGTRAWAGTWTGAGEFVLVREATPNGLVGIRTQPRAVAVGHDVVPVDARQGNHPSIGAQLGRRRRTPRN